jgi:hypothetical protein
VSKFTHGEVVRVMEGAPKEMRPGAQAWIVGVIEAGKRKGRYFEQFASGAVYTIEFEDGSSIDVDESDLEPAVPGSPT